MDGYTAYKTYLGVKYHFNKMTYDYPRYGAANAKYETFVKRNDRYYFERLAKKYKDSELVDFLIANFLEDKNIWIGDCLTIEAEEVYDKWCKRNQSLEYLYEQDLEKLCRYLEDNNLRFDDLFTSKNGNYPSILNMMIQNEILPETFCILDLLVSFMKNTDKDFEQDLIYTNITLKYKKYKSFLAKTNIKIFRQKTIDALTKYQLANT